MYFFNQDHLFQSCDTNYKTDFPGQANILDNKGTDVHCTYVLWSYKSCSFCVGGFII